MAQLGAERDYYDAPLQSGEHTVNPITVAKIALAVAGIVVFMLGVQSGVDSVRWTGVALVVAAFLLRFIGRGRRDAVVPNSEDR